MQTQFNTKPKKKINIFLLILLLIAVSVFTYWLTDISNDDIESRLNNEIKSLQSKVDSLNKELNDKSKANQPQDAVLPSEDALNKIKASISTGNTQPLEGYMASTVNVVLAASEGLGDRTATQASSDVTDFIDGAGTWDFSLGALTISSYSKSSYGRYFPDNAVVGKSSGGKVISLSFNEDAKIDQVFMANEPDIN